MSPERGRFLLELHPLQERAARTHLEMQHSYAVGGENEVRTSQSMNNLSSTARAHAAPQEEPPFHVTAKKLWRPLSSPLLLLLLSEGRMYGLGGDSA